MYANGLNKVNNENEWTFPGICIVMTVVCCEMLLKNMCITYAHIDSLKKVELIEESDFIL